MNAESPIHTYTYSFASHVRRRIVIGLFAHVWMYVFRSSHPSITFPAKPVQLLGMKCACMYVCRNVCIWKDKCMYVIINQVAAVKATYINTITRLRLRLQSCFYCWWMAAAVSISISAALTLFSCCESALATILGTMLYGIRYTVFIYGCKCMYVSMYIHVIQY